MYSIAEATRGFETDMAYPQYKAEYSQEDVISVHTWTQLQEYVQKCLNDRMFGGTDPVRRHMISILNGIIPFGMRITGG